jgi:hypothetical protein
MQLVFVFLALSIFCSHALSATYYVNNLTGNNSNPGSEASPWLTLYYATGALSAGDELVILGGDVAHPYTELLEVRSSGTTGNWITIRGQSDTVKPYIMYNGVASPVSIYNRSFIKIKNIISKGATTGQGFEIYNTHDLELDGVEAYNTGKNGILAQGGYNVTIKNCKIDTVQNAGVAIIGKATNMIHDTVVEGCTISNVAQNDGITLHEADPGDIVGANHIIRNNTLSSCHEEGLDITSGNNVTATDNITFNNNGGITIGHTAYGVTVQRHQSTNDVSFGISIGGPSHDVVVEDSVFTGANSSARLVINGAHTVNITRNQFLTSATSGPIVDFLSGAADGITILGNEFGGSAPRGGASMMRSYATGLIGNPVRSTWGGNTWWDPTGDSGVFYDVDAGAKYNITVFRSKTESNDQFKSLVIASPVFSLSPY